MKIKFIQNIIDFIRIEIDELYKNEYKLFYIGGAKHKNAGDMFNETIMEYFKIPYRKTKVSNTNLLCVGSLMEAVVIPITMKVGAQKSKNCIVIGAGFIQEEIGEEKVIKDLDIRALRGNLTKIRMEKVLGKNLDDCVLADAGILASYFFPMPKTNKYKVGIIAHFVDKSEEVLKNIEFDNVSCKFIDIEQDVKNLFAAINECECILSSSLHGLIFADSYGIPNRQIILSEKIIGGLYKYRDYYSGYGMELPSPYDLRHVKITEHLIDTVIKEYQPLESQIKNKQKELVKIYDSLKIKEKHNERNVSVE